MRFVSPIFDEKRLDGEAERTIAVAEPALASPHSGREGERPGIEVDPFPTRLTIEVDGQVGVHEAPGVERQRCRCGSNFDDTGAHFYNVYETADGGYVAVAAIEPKFYAELLQRVGLDAGDLPDQWDRDAWAGMQSRLASMFRQKTRAEWCEILEHTDACFAPVLSFAEAPEHAHNVARATFTEVAGVVQPAPAPRFSRTPAGIQGAPVRPGRHTDEVLAESGFSPARIAALRAGGVVA